MKEQKQNKFVEEDNIRIYSLDYLASVDLSENDLDMLISNHCLKYSLIVNMFRFAEYKTPISTILKIIKKDNSWQNKYTWNKTKFKEFSNIVKKIFYNIYRYNGDELESYVQWFMIQYGLTVKS